MMGIDGEKTQKTAVIGSNSFKGIERRRETDRQTSEQANKPTSQQANKPTSQQPTKLKSNALSTHDTTTTLKLIS
jgi:hypothetical protein